MNDPSPSVAFIEIERADIPLFTKSGDPSAQLTHAIRQVQDWKNWVKKNRSYFHSVLQQLVAEEMPDGKPERGHYWGRNRIKEGVVYGFHDEYIVIAGRRHTMDMSTRLRLAQMNHDLHDIRIITYDVLLELLLRYYSSGKLSPYWLARDE